jgi:hypothetical protein
MKENKRSSQLGQDSEMRLSGNPTVSHEQPENKNPKLHIIQQVETKAGLKFAPTFAYQPCNTRFQNSKDTESDHPQFPLSLRAPKRMQI